MESKTFDLIDAWSYEMGPLLSEYLVDYLVLCEEDPATGCWNYPSRTRCDKYPTIHLPSLSVRESLARLVFRAFVGPLRPCEVVRHRCDNTRCVNPDHLDGGSQLMNVRDCFLRGRSGRARLSQEDVESIRRAWRDPERRLGLGTVLARRYGVTRDAISACVRRKSWRWL